MDVIVSGYAACVGAPWGHAVVEALKPEIELAVIANPEPCYRTHSFRYVFFLNWSHIVPKEVTYAFECVNFHCTALPYGRGGHPIENLILRGHTETVIAAHRMTTVIDGGPVYCVSEPVSLAGSKAEILWRFVEPVAGMIRKIIDEEPVPVEQEHWKTVIFKRLSQDELDAVWEKRKVGRQT